jgi:hypothetical protein
VIHVGVIQQVVSHDEAVSEGTKETLVDGAVGSGGIKDEDLGNQLVGVVVELGGLQ